MNDNVVSLNQKTPEKILRNLINEASDMQDIMVVVRLKTGVQFIELSAMSSERALFLSEYMKLTLRRSVWKLED